MLRPKFLSFLRHSRTVCTGTKHIMWIRTIPRLHVTSQELPYPTLSAGREKNRSFATTPGRTVNLRFEKEPNKFLKQFGRDLTEEARAGRLDPVIGRDETIQRCLQVLARRTKNNPILIGEAGVGKTAIAEGLAQHIISGQVRCYPHPSPELKSHLHSIANSPEHHSASLNWCPW